MTQYGIQEMAYSLYDGGWRWSDREDMQEEYDLTPDEAEKIADILLSLERDSEVAEVERMTAKVEERKTRSAWDNGVKEYALELLEDLREQVEGGYETLETLTNRAAVEKALLNGATDWSQYSWGGSSLIYDCDIASRLCCPSELKKTRYGERRPNTREEWLDTQARALWQASRWVCRAFDSVRK